MRCMSKTGFTTEEAARYLGVTTGRVRQMIVDGTLKTERFGHVHVISREALEAAKRRKTTPGPAPKPNPSGKRAGKKKGGKK